jgi:hypothetical protein
MAENLEYKDQNLIDELKKQNSHAQTPQKKIKINFDAN